MATATKRHPIQDTSYHDRRLARKLEDPEFRAGFERQKRELETIDGIVNELDSLREKHGLTKAELARAIGKNPAAIRRLLTAPANPELRTVVALADALDADVRIVPRARNTRRRSKVAHAN
jgi:DNA-binding XRE family transcriptional regulator